MDYANPKVLVDTEWVQNNLNNTNIRIAEADYNPKSAYHLRHIPGSVLFDLREDVFNPISRKFLNKEAFQELLQGLGIDDDTILILYGDSNNTSAAYAFWVLKLYGYGDVRLMDGGRKKWLEENRPTTGDIPRYPRGNFRASKPNRNIQAQTFEAKQALLAKHKTKTLYIESSRVRKAALPISLPRFRNKLRSAVKVPPTRIINYDGTFKPRENLERFYAHKGITPNKKLITSSSLGRVSSPTWFTLKYLLGYPNVKNLHKGYPSTFKSHVTPRKQLRPRFGSPSRDRNESTRTPYTADKSKLQEARAKTTHDRYADASFPSKINLGEEAPLIIVIRIQEPTITDDNGKSKSIKHIQVDPKFYVTAIVDQRDNFSVVGGKYWTRIVVPPDRDSDPAMFELKALKKGDQKIGINFWQSGRYLGALWIKTRVLSKELRYRQTPRTVDNLRTLGKQPRIPDKPINSKATKADLYLNEENVPKPDLTIGIYQVRSTPQYVYDIFVTDVFLDYVNQDHDGTLKNQLKKSLEMYSQRLKEEGTPDHKYVNMEYYEEGELRPLARVPLTPKAEEIVRKTLDSLEGDLKPDEIKSYLEGYGLNLYTALFPEIFRKIYWKYKSHFKSILLVTADPYNIPWELVKPYSDDNEVPDPFLCENHSFTRWIHGRNGIPPSKELKRILAVIPKHVLKSARKETEYFKTEMEKKRRLSVIFKSERGKLLNTLEEGKFDLVHFSTHGSYNKDDQQLSAVDLDNKRALYLVDIHPTWKQFKRAKPIVIMSTCQSSQGGFSLSNVDGWAMRFLEAGASIFVGTLWSVSSEVANAFTQYLYDNISNSESIGLADAVLMARQACSNRFKSGGEYSWLAYQLYAKEPNIETKLRGNEVK